ncbi:MAG: hypothetical protein SFW35_11180 [Chitinophagales bacterium]|nr:hypothetical protein [Chitinophagales bacterium]
MFVLPFNFFLTFVATCVAGEINYNWGLYQGLANIVSWFRIPIFITIPIILGAIAASVIFGYSFGKTTLRFIYSSKLGRDRSGRREFLLFSYFLPSWLGLCLLLPILSAYSVVLHIAFITNLFFIGVGMLFRSDNLRMGVKADKRDVLNHLSPAFYIGLPVIYALIIFFL